LPLLIESLSLHTKGTLVPKLQLLDPQETYV
jgi:hypothetical protein